jgi:hypothetical protein
MKTQLSLILILLLLSSCANKSSCKVNPGVNVDGLPTDTETIRKNVTPKANIKCNF